MKRGGWRAGMMGLVAAALVAVLTGGAARAASGQDDGALALVHATKVSVFHPAGTQGAAVNGTCDMGESIALNRADAWRCMAGNFIYDPCFSAAPHATSVICGATPQHPLGIRLRLSAPLPTHGPVRGTTQPWILQLGDGTTCSFATGATFGIGQQRANYDCTDKQWVLGYPSRGRVWLAVKAQLSTKPSPNGPSASRIYAVSVATAWS